jgi:hypothetical protein
MNEPTDPLVIRAAASKIITSPVTNYSYRIRRINQLDFNRHKISTILPEKQGAWEELSADDQRVFLGRVLDSTQYTLERGAGIFFGEESATPPGAIHVDWIAGDEGFLSDEILKFSGLDTESQKAIEDLLKNANGSGSPTPLAENTDVSPASF